jgi:hypothetical protein
MDGHEGSQALQLSRASRDRFATRVDEKCGPVASTAAVEGSQSRRKAPFTAGAAVSTPVLTPGRGQRARPSYSGVVVGGGRPEPSPVAAHDSTVALPGVLAPM